MKRALVNLGQTPLQRRIVAAALLLGAAAFASWLRASGKHFWIELGLNLTVAWVAFGFLHFRWRAREERQITPDKAEDIFS